MKISELPDNGLRQLAIDRCQEQYHRTTEYILKNYVVDDISWDETREGFDFWADINRGDFSVYNPDTHDLEYPEIYDEQDEWPDEDDYEPGYQEGSEDGLEEDRFVGDESGYFNNYTE